MDKRFFSAVLDALVSNIAVVDAEGTITYINDAWVRFARENGDPRLLSTGIGVNYVNVCHMAVRDDPSLTEMVQSIDNVIQARIPSYSCEYPCHSPDKKRWFLLGARHLNAEPGGAVFFHLDITEKKLAEEVTKRINDELEKRLAERTASLVQANQELQGALSEIQALEAQLERENFVLRETIRTAQRFPGIIGHSDAMNAVLLKVKQVAPTDAPVLLMGETGTGKGLFAKALHESSERKDKPLVQVNCASLPAQLIESELFGHEKGAYTTAYKKRIGRFELADGATLFLDEIGDLPMELQAKLLRVLQDHEFERIGSSRTIKVDVRVIAATNRNLTKAIEDGRFREDLWYRLSVFPITVPPLRERREDIPELVTHFVSLYNRKLGKQVNTTPRRTLERLMDYNWPGNVRELENIVHRAVIVTEGKELVLDVPDGAGRRPLDNTTLEDVQRQHIITILKCSHWKIEGKGGAAERLGINPSTLRSRMKKLQIQKGVRPGP
ncbi:MAG: sigma 54-interacting transcriptional regulator [Deltaproteobacteria bacterium]|nr:sigma 54-interacting transcriptional regulator [Deltaproteobacteria bacterium]